jgi:hypothetical protein
MSAVAEVHIAGDSRVFVADELEIRDQAVIAHGRTRRKVNGLDEWGDPCRRAWPWQRIYEIRFVDEAGDA